VYRSWKAYNKTKVVTLSDLLHLSRTVQVVEISPIYVCLNCSKTIPITRLEFVIKINKALRKNLHIELPFHVWCRRLEQNEKIIPFGSLVLVLNI